MGMHFHNFGMISIVLQHNNKVTRNHGPFNNLANDTSAPKYPLPKAQVYLEEKLYWLWYGNISGNIQDVSHTSHLL